MMKLWGEGIRAWWRRRTRGFVAAPKLHGGRGTSWQEHKRYDVGFTCRCGEVLAFMDSDLVIREQDHSETCSVPFVQVSVKDHVTGAPMTVERCDCRITDARYVKICPACHLGHWKNATPQLVDAKRSNA